MMKTDDKYIQEFSRKLLFYLTFKRFVRLGTVFLFAWGLVVLLLRAGMNIPSDAMFLGFSGIIPLFLTALFLESTRIPERSCIAALLDQYNHVGGLFMARHEIQGFQWSPMKKKIHLPALVWHGLGEWLMFGLAVLFAAGAAFTPPYISNLLNHPHPLEIKELVNDLTAKVDLLEEEDILETPEAEKMKKKLNAFAQEASGDDPAKTWEAVDLMENQVSSHAQNYANEILETMAELRQAQRMAQLLDSASYLNPQVQADAMKELTAMLQEIEKERQAFSELLDKALQEAIQEAGLTSKDIKTLNEALKKLQKDMIEKLKRLSQEDLANVKIDNILECDDSALKEFLDKNAKNLTVADILMMSQKEGTHRGQGDANITWKDPSTETKVKFKEKIVPLLQLPSIQKSIMTGISHTAPETNQETVVRPGALSGAKKGSSAAFRPRILPRHKGTIQRYFNREDKKESDPPKPLIDEIWSGWS